MKSPTAKAANNPNRASRSIAKQHVVAVILARQGSKGLRHKNIQPLAGLPLLVRTIRLLQQCAHTKEQWHIVVSTDSRRYAALAKQEGANVVMRPKKLASDSSRQVDAMLHAIDLIETWDLGLAAGQSAWMMTTPSTPFLAPKDIRKALALYWKNREHAVVSVIDDPYADSWRFTLNGDRLNGKKRMVKRRQEGPKYVVLQGGIFVSSAAFLRRHRQYATPNRTLGLKIPHERALDIESVADLALAEAILTSDFGCPRV